MYIFVPTPARINPFTLPVHRRHHDHRRQQLVPLFSSQKLTPSSKKPSQKCEALSKQGQRFMSSLATATAGGDISAANRLIKKFVAASPKSIALDALTHLLSPQSNLSSLAFPLYLKIAEARWFDWNPKLVANVAASLDKQGQYGESTSLISDSISKLKLNERDLLQFYCNLVESHSKHDSIRGFDESFRVLKELVYGSNSVYVKKQGFKSMVSGLCEIGRPREAENLIEEMKMMKGGAVKVKPSMFEFRCVVYAYGRLGLIEEMKKSIDKMEKEGFEIDTVCSNMVLASYGAQNALGEMVMWLQKMKDLGIPFSLRTCNSVFNSCPTIMSLVVANSSFQDVPVSIQELIKILSSEEAKLIEEIVGSCAMKEAIMKWDELEGKLDLHGMHLSSAYVMMLIWIEEMRERLNNSGNENVVPAEITVVCGSGNHSIVRGESPVKQMVKEIMVKTKSPMRIDRKNNGCFIAKGKTVKQWLSC